MTKTVQVLELRQKRCGQRFGVGACGATGSPKCMNTFATCTFRSAFNLDGELRWYFTRHGDAAPRTAARPTDNDWYGPTIPILQTVTTEPTRINLGAVRELESAFGLLGTISATLDDFEFRNQFGDYYADERTIKGSLGRLILAWVGEAISQLEMYLYTGKDGDALSDMVQRRYDVTNISPPSEERWTISGIDPLGRAGRKKAQFPRPTDLRLQSNISSASTAITVSGKEIDISDKFGNTPFQYARIGGEVFRYRGYTGSDGIWTLSNVVRGVLGTSAIAHSVDDGVQRVGHYERIRYYDMVYDLLANHTTIDTALIPYATQWAPEGGSYLSTLQATGTYTDPKAVDEICANAIRDGMFVMWFDERVQQIKIKALRQPTKLPVELNEKNAIVSSAIKRTPDDRRTRVTIYYGRKDPTESIEEGKNYLKQRVRIDGEAESENFADGTVRNLIWYSPLMRSDSNALLVQATFLQRYRNTPRYIELTLSNKNADISIGDVVSVTSYDVIDTLGNPVTEAWEVIEWEEIEPGFEYRVLCQSFILFERPGFIMANDAPTFENATDAQKVNACYITENDGTMSDGTEGYVIQ